MLTFILVQQNTPKKCTQNECNEDIKMPQSIWLKLVILKTALTFHCRTRMLN